MSESRNLRIRQGLAKERVFEILEPVWRRNADVPEGEIETDVHAALCWLREQNRRASQSTTDGGQQVDVQPD